MAQGQNTTLSRRAALASAGAAAIASLLPVDLSAEAITRELELTAPTPGGPLEIVSRCFSYMDEHSANPVTFQLRCGTFRKATWSELRDELDRWIFGCEHVEPEVLRDLFRDTDGELLALLTEAKWARRAICMAKDDAEALRVANEDYELAVKGLAACRVRTPGGAALLLDWYRSAIFFERDALTPDQQYAILGRIACVNYTHLQDGEGARNLSQPVAREWAQAEEVAA